MKFGKQLEEERLQEWIDQYLDYKMMKKALKVEQERDGCEIFIRTLDSQLQKVALFMRSQQELISADLRPLEHFTGSDSSSSRRNASSSQLVCRNDSHCEHLVRSISMFQSYVQLNHTALRKIVKKFDKRFQVSFMQEFATPLPARTWLTAGDVETWMLAPARRCMMLMHNPLPPRTLWSGHGEADAACQVVQSRANKSLSFWIDELRTGCQLAALRVGGAPADVDDESEQYIVKNTFLDIIDDESGNYAGNQQNRRCGSVPPVLKEGRRSAVLGEAARAARNAADFQRSIQRKCTGRGPRAEEIDCDQEQDSKARSCSDLSDVRSGSDVDTKIGWQSDYSTCDFKAEKGDEAPWQSRASQPKEPKRQRGRRIPSNESEGDDMPGGCWDSHASFASNSTERKGSKGRNGNPHPYGSYYPPDGDTSSSAVGQMSMTASTRWWGDIQDVCLLTGFPISLLPYPPFKLPSYRDPTLGVNVPTRLVDGLYLALQVLSTWRFEMLGRQLSSNDISSLDLYLKKCKLGPSSLRVGYALQLLGYSTPASLRELDQIRGKASKRLEAVRHIQRVRLSRDAPQELQATPKKCAGAAVNEPAAYCCPAPVRPRGASNNICTPKANRASCRTAPAGAPLPVGPVSVGRL